MQHSNLNNKVAVVTGGAKGIGYALAKHLAGEGVRIILADIDEKSLQVAENKLREGGAEVTGVLTDVTKFSSVQSLKEKAYSIYNEVNLLVNNAGVSGAVGAIWETPLTAFEWTLNVNLMGAVHCIKSFLPDMIKQQDSWGHVLNTASMYGLFCRSDISAYQVSKHALVALSEGLYLDLKLRRIDIGVSVLCPGYVKTDLIHSEKKSPGNVRADLNAYIQDEYSTAARKDIIKEFIHGRKAEEVASIAINGIKNGDFYILTEKDTLTAVRARMQSIRGKR